MTKILTCFFQLPVVLYYLCSCSDNTAKVEGAAAVNLKARVVGGLGSCIA